MKVTILSGWGRYQDRWHDFTATSIEVAKAVQPLGAEVVVRSMMPQAMPEVVDADLLVVNAGLGEHTELSDAPDDEWTEAFGTLRGYRARRGPVLALHAAANTLDGVDEWPQWIGGRWNRSTSMHPPIGDFGVQVTDQSHPITRGLSDFSLFDERYSYLDVYEGAEVLLDHTFEGRTHPLAWAVEQDGARSVYDGLGHGVAAFASPERVELLRREVGWLLGQDD